MILENLSSLKKHLIVMMNKLSFALGIDQPFLLNHQHDPSIYLYHPENGRLLEIKTTQIAVVVYTGNF